MYATIFILLLVLAFMVCGSHAFLAVPSLSPRYCRGPKALPSVAMADRLRRGGSDCLQNHVVHHAPFNHVREDFSFARAYFRARDSKRLLQRGAVFMSEAASTPEARNELDRFAFLVNNCLDSVRQVKFDQNTVKHLQGFSQRLDESCDSLQGQSIDRIWVFFEVGLNALLKEPDLTAMQHWLLGRVYRSLGRALVASLGPDTAEAAALIDGVAKRLVQYIGSHFRQGQMELSSNRANMLAASCMRLLMEVQESLAARYPLVGLDEVTAAVSRKVLNAIESASSDFSEDEVGDAYRAFLERNIQEIIDNMDASLIQNSSRNVVGDRARVASSYFDPIWRPTEAMIDFLKFIDVIPFEGAFCPIDEIPGVEALERHYYLLDPSNSVKNAWVKMLSRRTRQECNLCAIENTPIDVDDPSSSREMLASSRALFDYGRSLASAELCGWHLYSSHDNEEIEELWQDQPQDGINIIQEFGSKGKNISSESLLAVASNASSVLKETDLTVRPLRLLDPHVSNLDSTLLFTPHSMRLRIKSTFESLHNRNGSVEEAQNNSIVSSPDWVDNVGAVSMAVRLSAAAKGRAAMMCNASDAEVEDGVPGSSDAALMSALGRILSDHLTKASFSERELTNDLIGASALIEFMAVEEPEETVRGAVKVALISAVLKCSMQKESSTAFANLGKRIAILRPLITRCLLFESGSDVFNAQDSWFSADAEAAVADSAMEIIDRAAAAPTRNVSKTRKIVLAPEKFGSDQVDRRHGPVIEGIRRFISLKGLMGAALGIDTSDTEGDTPEDVERQVGEAYFASVASKVLIQGIEDLPGMDSEALGLYFKGLAKECGLNEMDASCTLMNLASMATSQVILEHLAPDSATSTDEQPSNDQPTGDQGATKDASEVSERLRALRHMYNMYQVPRPLFSGFESEADSYIGGCAKLCVDYICANIHGDSEDKEEQSGSWDKMATLARNVESVINLLNLTKGPKDEEFAIFLNLLKTAFTNLYITQGDTALLESFANELGNDDESGLQMRDKTSQRNR